MRKTLAGLTSLTVAVGLGVTLAPQTVASAAAAPVKGVAAGPGALQVDDLPNPLAEKQNALRQEAITQVLNGTTKVQTKNGAQVVKVGNELDTANAATARGKRVKAARHGKDQYVRLSRERTEKIFVVLAEFGNERATDIDPRYGDMDTDPDTPGPTVFDGPLHNQIPEPDRSTDNSTIWQPDYSADHYRQLYFGKGRGVESLKTYYQRQSSGRYSVDGEVTDWVKVRYNEARYGRSNGFPCAGIVCSNTWALLRDALTQWVADKKAAGATDASIKAELASFDQQDRYDYDGDGNFNEPDGYIDHFQIVHAGGDQADGDPYQGEDAIWSHRWYAYATDQGVTGPAFNKLGGTQIGDTGLWVGDYTIQPENGGLSVFAHEYGHDLGLPDHYDTAGGGDNAVNWWTLMAQSRARGKNDVGIGTRPADLGVWDKLQLGWLDYEVVPAGVKRTLNLGPHEYNSRKAQAVVVPLPKKEVTSDLVAPYEGSKSWWSGTGDDYTATMTRSVDLPAGQSAALTFQANYNIEQDYDYAFVEVNDGSGWVALPGTGTDPAANNGITGDTGGDWVEATFDLSAFAGKTVQLRVRYTADGGVQGNDPDLPAGIFVDAIAVTSGGDTIFTDGAESGANGWTLDDFSAVGASVTNLYDNYYLASNRQYVSYDRYLRYGPYNFGFPSQPDKVEFFPYQDGLLVNYWDTSYSDNNESQHPGHGLVLPIDAHPRPIYNLDGQPWRGRIQTYDAPFSLEKADSFTLHINGKPSYIRGQAAVPLFDDSRSYWSSVQPNVGVKVPNTGTTIRVLSQKGTSMKIRVEPKG